MKDAARKGALSQSPNGKSVTGAPVLGGASQNKPGGNTAAPADKIGPDDLDTLCGSAPCLECVTPNCSVQLHYLKFISN